MSDVEADVLAIATNSFDEVLGVVARPQDLDVDMLSDGHKSHGGIVGSPRTERIERSQVETNRSVVYRRKRTARAT
jgi:hypothetical protein